MSRQPPADVIAAAQLSDEQWKIPASVTLAQWALESGWGEHMPPGSCNPFGIKAKFGEPTCLAATKEVEDGKVISINAGFRKFATIADAFDYHARLLATNDAYRTARQWLPNVDMFCKGLTGLYATDPKYGDKLIAIINNSDFTRYDV